jgi:hypothetical protein
MAEASAPPGKTVPARAVEAAARTSSLGTPVRQSSDARSAGFQVDPSVILTLMKEELPAALAFAGGSVSISSATAAGLLLGVVLMAVATVLAAASAS